MKNVVGQPKLIDWMICDDVRTEINRKLMFIGVYQDIIGVSTIPFILSQLVVFTKWNTSKTPIKNFEFKIIQPDKKTIGPFIGKLLPSEEKQKTILQLVISPFQMPAAGKYEIVMKVNKTTYKVGTFQVVLMPEEKAKEEVPVAQ